MRWRTARGVWGATGLVVALWIAAIALKGMSRPGPSSSVGGSGVVDVLESAAVLCSFPLAGLLIASRRPGHPIGRLLVAIGIGWALLSFSSAYADYGLHGRLHPVTGAALAASYAGSGWIFPISVTGIFLLVYFPDGRLPGPRWRWLVRGGVLAIALIFASDVFQPGDMGWNGYPGIANPLGVGSAGGLIGQAQAIVLALPISILAAAASLVVRFRRTDRHGRLQIAWLALAACATGVLFLVDLVASAVVDAHVQEPTWLTVLDDICIIGFATIPAAIVVAVLRHRLYDIEVIVRRTITYGAVAFALAAVFAGGILLGGTGLRAVTGSSGTVSVTLSTLAVALAFQPVRRVVGQRVDRRFSRSAYDARAAIDAFAERLRLEVDLDALCDDLCAVVGRTVAPARASVWIRPGGQVREDDQMG